VRLMLPGRTDETAPVFPIAGAVFLERFRLLTTISPLFFVRLTGLNIFQHPALGHQGVIPTGKKITLEEKWRQQAEAAKKEAEKLPHGKEREALMRKARQLQTASQINEWLSSPALQPPK
jgi:hypothetical protein